MAAPSTAGRLEEVLRNFFRNRLKEIWTCLPAQVETVNDDGTIDCTPSIQMLERETFKEIEPRLLRKVPIINLGGAGWRIEIPVRVNQQVLLLMANRGLDDWKVKLEKGSMPDEGLWSQKDSLALPLSIGEDWETEPESPFKITNHENDKEIILDEDGAKFVAGKTSARLNFDGVIQLEQFHSGSNSYKRMRTQFSGVDNRLSWDNDFSGSSSSTPQE